MHLVQFSRTGPSFDVRLLAPLFWLGRIYERRPRYQEVTRLFTALSVGIAELETFYSKVDFSIVSSAWFFPYITFTDHGTGCKVEFLYERYEDWIPGGTKAVFIAKTQMIGRSLSSSRKCTTT